MFPGRTLEELDNIDWFRLQRALQARHIRHIEHMRQQLRTGKLTADKADQDVLAEVKRHDLIAEHYGIQ